MPKTSKMQNLKKKITTNEGFLKASDISTRTQWRRLRKMLDEGVVSKVQRGLYRLNDDDAEANQYVEIAKIVPDGILCMYSTWLHYELSVQIPQEYNIAIEKSRKVSLPDYPPIKLYFWKKEFYELGIDNRIVDGASVKMYDVEKSVCDAVRFRNKIGMDTTAEILRNYLKRSDCNFTKLMQYAKIMRIENTIRTYIEIQL